jgi:hypothetical protein
MSFTTVPISFMGFDFMLELDFDITYRGGPATYWNAPEDPEWNIEQIVLRNESGAGFEATERLFDVLATFADAAILKYLDDSNDLDWLEYDEDYYRDER